MRQSERFKRGLQRGLLSLPLVGFLAGCGGSPPADTGAQLTTPPQRPVPPRPAPAKPASVSAGFTPLPTPAQVLAASPDGRIDPFAPVRFASPPSGAPAATGSAGQAGTGPVVRPPLTLPEGFRFNGVISAGGVPQAIVQYGGESGSLSIGDRGGRSTTLLPPGWSVASIDVSSGRLTLFSRQLDPKGQRVTAEL